MGRGKVQLKKIQNPISRQVSFCKRKTGLMKKARELSVLCDAEVALIVFSPTGKYYEFGSPNINRIVGKYQTFSASTEQCSQLSENREALLLEVDNLQTKMAQLEKMNNLMIGDDLDSVQFKDLQHLEKQLNLSVRKIRSKKDKCLLRHVGSLKIKQRSLKEENANLREKLGRSHKVPSNDIQIIQRVNCELERDAVAQQNLNQSSHKVPSNNIQSIQGVNGELERDAAAQQNLNLRACFCS